ncbi:galactokinase family protein [Actinomyces vulturis]|uniref:galactokinase family protein n=1 Tax=Actinomyces vulturis TaxID=1857645 RepID=UPI000A84E292|nr:galactokinase family protein [Actinomyces vulturis]
MSLLETDAGRGPLTSRVDEVTWFVPGRIEVLGKHTDYAGGRTLTAAASHGLTFTGQALEEPILRVTSQAVNDTVEIPLDAPSTDRHGHWSGYPAAVASRLVSNFGSQVRGAHITVDSNLPLASGMSSSSAMIVGLARTMMDLSGLEATEAFTSCVTTPELRAHYLACVENGQTFENLEGHRGVGTFGGSEDHTAMLCGKQGVLSQYSFCPTSLERRVPWPDDYSIVVAVSGVLAEKSGTAREKYNRAALSTHEIVKRWNENTGRSDVYLADAVTSSESAAEEIRSMLKGSGYLQGRFEQFLIENETIVPQAGDALIARDIEEFGRLVDLSQHWTEEGLNNQVPETVALQRFARELGAPAASAFGAGFGGSVWALVTSEQADDFAAQWLKKYTVEFPEVAPRASTLVTTPGDSAQRTIN